MRSLVNILIAAALTIGCMAPGPHEIGGQRLRIGDLDVVDLVDDLPQDGRAKVLPWPGPWWPFGPWGTYQGGGTAWEWLPGRSPVGKYGRLFGAEPEGIVPGWRCGPSSADPETVDCETSLLEHPELAHSTPNGDSLSNWLFLGRSGAVAGDYTGAWQSCSDSPDGMRRCTSRSPEDWELTFHSVNRPDTHSWSGHCDGWAFAAVAEPQPLHAVTLTLGERAETFEVGDIMALLAELHSCDTEGAGFGGEPDDLRAVDLVGEDCVMALDGIARDPRQERACNDVDAGTLHVVLASVIGLHGRAFYLDSDSGQETWNFPVYGYRIRKNDPIGEADALRLLGRTGSAYAEINAAAVAWRHVVADLSLVKSAPPSTTPLGVLDVELDFTRKVRLEYVLELDGGGRILGGQYTRSSNAERPDTLKIVRRVEPIPALQLSHPYCRNPLLSYARMREILALSRQCDSDHPEWACDDDASPGS